MKAPTQINQQDIERMMTADEIKWLAVLINVAPPVETLNASLITLDMLAGQMFRPLLKRGLEIAGVEIFESAEPRMDGSYTNSFYEACVFFYVRDVVAAVESIERDLGMLKLLAFSCICYFDKRESFWRTVSPAQPKFDPHVWLTNPDRIEAFCKARETIRSQS